MNKIQLSTLLQQPWCIMPEFANALLPVASGILNQEHHQHDFSEERKAMIPLMVSGAGKTKSWNMSDAPDGSVLVLNLKGPILKDSQFCGPVGTQELANMINEAKNNSNIVGAVCVIESGGGSAYAIKPMADAIMAFTQEKPFISLCEDVMASAAYYIASYSTEIFANNPKSIIGSIGTMTSVQDVKPALEKMGVVFHEIYATESTSKNKMFNDVLAGNYNGYIKKMLDPLNADFIAAVKNNRSGKISTSEKLIYQGETWFASVAIELGMIDQLGNLDAAVSRVQELAQTHKSTQQTNMNFEKVQALAGVENPGEEQIDLANAELTEAGITGATMVAESFITEAANVTAQNTQLTQQLAEAQTALAASSTAKTEAETALTTANQNITNLQGRVDAFGNNAGALHTTKFPKEGEEQPNAEDEAAQAMIDALPHNQKADKLV